MIQPGQTPDPWGLKCTCEAGNRFATLHNGQCDLFQKFPPPKAPTTRDGAPRRTGYVLEDT
ncbi:hypothetical protein IX27_18285 [Streptomyces sp. JS01]|uniref:hypothetical protein n=1 Tax=Streptomyces sp. JS01 TaxID=1525753 RepID=UPI0005009C65|nr:hypothetical protein [Streptomyces sp. JS01]KFK87840.1 hypothetical protein IX27_18285 [Streptomyces sp. JS01]